MSVWIDGWELAVKMDRWTDRWMTEGRRGAHLSAFLHTDIPIIHRAQMAGFCADPPFPTSVPGIQWSYIPKSPVPSVSLTTCPS